MAKKLEERFDLEKLRAVSLQPPSAVEAEVSVLGAVLLDDSSVPKAVEVLRPECFHDKRNRIIFEAMTSLYSSNEPIDSISLYHLEVVLDSDIGHQ